MDRNEIKERIANWFGYEDVSDVPWSSGCVLSGSRHDYFDEPAWLTLGEVTDLIESIVKDAYLWYEED